LWQLFSPHIFQKFTQLKPSVLSLSVTVHPSSY
jgi:hypothetical protein